MHAAARLPAPGHAQAALACIEEKDDYDLQVVEEERLIWDKRVLGEL